MTASAGVIPDIQRAAVDTHQWMTAKEFLDLFAASYGIPRAERPAKSPRK